MSFNTSLDRVRDQIVSDWRLIVWMFIVVVLTYGQEIFSFSLSIDEESSFNMNLHGAWLSAGRWGLVALQKTVLPSTFIPFFTTILTLFFLCCTAYVLQYAFSLKGFERWVFCFLYVCFPQFAYQVQFAIQSDCIAVGLLCAAISFVSLQRYISGKKWYWGVFCLLLNAFTTSIYQSLIFVLPSLCVLWSLVKLTREDDSVFKMKSELWCYFYCGVFSVLGLIVYVFLSKVLSHISGVGLSGGYLLSYVGWLNGPFSENLTRVMLSGAQHFLGEAYAGEQVFLSLIVAMVGMLYFVFTRYRGWDRVWGILVLGAVMLVPFLQNIIFGSAQPARTLLVQGIVLAIVWAMFLRVFPVLKYAVFCVVLASVLFSAAQVNRLFYGDYMRWQTDMLLANRIVSSIYAQNPSFDASKTALYMHGKPLVVPSLVEKGETFGSSFFTHDNGNIMRMAAFLRMHGLPNLRFPSKSEIGPLLKDVETMPLWPASGSIKMIDGVLVVKLGEQAGFIGW